MGHWHRPMRSAPTTSARLLPLLAALTALAPLSIDIYTPSLPLMQAELGGADWLAQASITTFLLGIGLGQLVWGPLSDSFGRRPVVIAGIAGWALASAASALAISAPMLVGVRLVAGLCGAAGIVVARSIVRDISPDGATTSSRIGILAMVTTLAPVLAPIAGATIALAWGWRGDFTVLAGLGVGLVALFAAVAPETLPASARQPGGVGSVTSSLLTAGRHRELVLVSFTMAAHSVGFYAYIATASFIVERELHRSALAFAVVFGTNAIMVISANQVFRKIVRRHHPSRPVGAGLVLCAVGGTALVSIAIAHGPEAALWGASLVFAAGQGLVLPGTHSWAQATSVSSGAASALVGSAQFLGGVLGSPVTGVVGPTAAHLGGVITLASGGATLLWLAAVRRVPSPTPSHQGGATVP